MYFGLQCYIVLTEGLLSTLGALPFYRQAKRPRVQARGVGVIIFSLKLFCIAELSSHAEF